MLSAYGTDMVGDLGTHIDAQDVAWLLFAQTGLPGMYMLYSDLRYGEDDRRTPLD